MRYKNEKLLLASILIVLVLPGCASMGLGESEYACKGYPDGIGCISSSEAYEMTNADLPAIREMIDERQKEKDLDGDTDKVSVSDVNVARTIRRSEQPMPVPHLDDGAVPIRTPSQTMRIWIAPWEDERGNLQITGRVYTEIEPRRWVIGLPAKNVSNRLRLLQAAERLGENPRENNQAKDYGKGVKQPKGD